MSPKWPASWNVDQTETTVRRRMSLLGIWARFFQKFQCNRSGRTFWLADKQRETASSICYNRRYFDNNHLMCHVEMYLSRALLLFSSSRWWEGGYGCSSIFSASTQYWYPPSSTTSQPSCSWLQSPSGQPFLTFITSTLSFAREIKLKEIIILFTLITIHRV